MMAFGSVFSGGVFEMGKRFHATDSKDATVEPNREW